MTNSRDDYNLSQPFSLGFSAKISIDPIKLQCQVHSTSNRQECKQLFQFKEQMLHLLNSKISPNLTSMNIVASAIQNQNQKSLWTLFRTLTTLTLQ